LHCLIVVGGGGDVGGGDDGHEAVAPATAPECAGVDVVDRRKVLPLTVMTHW
jgi:hypothetical protein